MRKKIFIILFTGISLFTIVTTSELIFFFRRERARLIDQQVEVLASSILATGIFESRFDEVQAQVSKALGTRETVAFLSIYDRNLNARFRNSNAKILFGAKVIQPLEKWMTVAFEGHRVRLLNLRTQAGGNWIQVGLLIDQENAEWDTLAARAYFIIGALLVGVALASFFLSRALLKPLSELATDLRIFSSDLEGRKSSQEIFSKWSEKTLDHDAFSDLVSSLVELRSKLVGKLKMNDATLSHMAHELKTPLAVIRAGTESLLIDAKSEPDRQQLEELLSEADRLSDTISSFLTWSRFNQIQFQGLEKTPFSLQEVVADIVSGLSHIYPGRMKTTFIEPKTVLDHRPHVEQAMRNIITNALKYSLNKVQIRLEKEFFTVSDSGGGIPDIILKRVGEPFNSGVSGTGLGLAWVKILCEQHGWKLDIKTTEAGTIVDVQFQQPVS